MGLKRYRLVFFVVFLVLLGLEIFALVKSPFIFVGLEERVWPFLLAVFILLVASFIPWRILRNMHKVVNLVFLIFLGFSFVNIFWLDFKVIGFLIATCILGGIKLLLEHFNKKKDLFLREEAYKYLFLAMLILISLGSFFDFFSSRMTGLSIITILLGVFVFYYNRDVIDEIEDEKEDEEKAEQKRAKEFDRKFPKLAWFNFEYGITKNWKNKKYFISILRALMSPFIWIARLPYSFVKWMYKEGWWYSLGLIAILTVGLVLRLWKLGNVSFWFDELLHVTASHNLRHGILPEMPSGSLYLRNIFTTWIVFLTKPFFPMDEFHLRLPMVILSLIIIFLGYIIGKKIFNKKAGILSAILISLYPPIVVFSQELRYYVPLTILVMLSFIVLISKIKTTPKILLLASLTYIGMNTSLLMLLVVLSLVFFYFLQKFIFSNDKKAFLKKNNKLLLSILIISALLIIYKFKTEIIANKYFSEESIIKFNPIYFNFLPQTFLILFLLSCFYSVILLFGKQKQDLSVLGISTINLMLLMSFFNTRFTGGLRFINHLIPFILILVCVSIFQLFNFNSSSFKKVAVLIVLLMLVIPTIEYLLKDTHLETKEKFTWTRPNYKDWKELDIPNNATKVAIFPHTVEIYVGKIDYALRTDGIYEKDPYVGTPVITNLRTNNLTEKCTYIFADYREKNLWNEEIWDDINKKFIAKRGRGAHTYISKECFNNES